MLSLTPASAPRSISGRRPVIGLAIAGGGPLGAIYELAVLKALDEALDGVRMHDLDVYVGVSSGAILASSLANRMSATRMARIFMGTANAEFSFRPEQFLRPALREYTNRAVRIPATVLKMAGRFIRDPRRMTGLEGLDGLSRLLPTGIFDNHGIERFLKSVFEKPGRSNDFNRLEATLRIIAVELETGRAVRFGEPGFDHVPVSRAVQASAALPGLYPPVEIDGRLYVDGALRRTLNASAALDEGTDLLIAINPLVPHTAAADDHPGNAGHARRMISGGLPVVLSQTFRSLIQSRMQIGMRKYEHSYPHAGIMLVEPDRSDEKMFYTNVFSYASRNELIEHAYRQTRAELLSHADQLEMFLAPFGLGVNRGQLRSRHSFADSLKHEVSGLTPVSQSLSRALDRLERLL